MLHKLFLWLAELFRTGCNGGPMRIIFKAPGISIGGIMNASIVSGLVSTFGVTLDADAAGNPTSLPGPLSWSVDNAAVAILTPSADGATVDVKGGLIGAFVLTATSGNVVATMSGSVTGSVATAMEIVQVTPVAAAPAVDPTTAAPVVDPTTAAVDPNAAPAPTSAAV